MKMKMKMKMKRIPRKFCQSLLGVLLLVSVGSAFADSIIINTPDGGVTCTYNKMIFEKDKLPELDLVMASNGEVCTVVRANGGATNIATTPDPISPVGLVSGTKPASYSWVHVPGATEYKVQIHKGNIDTPSDEIGYFTVDASMIANICVASVCTYTDPVVYSVGGATGLANGTDYVWRVRVKQGTGAVTSTGFNQVQAKNFTIQVTQSQDQASESIAEFDNAFYNINYNFITGANDFATKEGLRALVNYQPLTNGRDVYIVNQAESPETIIPSCVNGKNGVGPTSDCNPNGQPRIALKTKEIYSLRLKTKQNYTAASLRKISHQIYNVKGALFRYVVSDKPGNMDEANSDPAIITGKCGVSALQLSGVFSLSLRPPSSNLSPEHYCLVAPDTRLYLNIQLLDNQTQCDDGSSPSCQIDIVTGGFVSRYDQ